MRIAFARFVLATVFPILASFFPVHTAASADLRIFEPIKWSGLWAGVDFMRPTWNSTIAVDDGTTIDKANMSGFHICGSAAYRFQQGMLVFGPMAELCGGPVSAMPGNSTYQTNGTLTGGVQGGIALGRFYTYGYALFGAASITDSYWGATAKHFVGVTRLGAATEWQFQRRWTAKLGVDYSMIDDARSTLGGMIVNTDRKAAVAIKFGFSRQLYD
ncbi:MAG TPA: hypothetical protein VGP13_04265 [Candidatus Paceibacterota bacterium]|jgi:hypothetical protein|nr:hypothetical protein [Candidatus Paceibacterota bacterium]